MPRRRDKDARLKDLRFLTQRASPEALAATGSDTGGSIRAPAAANGIVSIKPTYGRVSKAGVAVLSWSLDHAGPMARTVLDLAILLNIMAGQDPRDPHTKDMPVPDYVASLTGDISGIRLGVPTNYFTDDVDPAVANAVAKAISELEHRSEYRSR